jgi:hypothetical protein
VAPAGTDQPRVRLAPWVAEAWRDVWPAFVVSRLLVFAAAAIASSQYESSAAAARRATALPYLHPFSDWPLGGLLDAILAPLARFDSIWYLAIAQDGYLPQTLPGNIGVKAAFFPLYPELVRIVSITGDPATTLIASYVVSGAAFLIALLLLHRLTSLELGRRYARPAVMLMAFAPTSYFFSAPYTESLFLAVTIGAFLAARQGHWAAAGVLAVACSATRNTGVLILLPLLLLYLYGPRGEEQPGAEPARRLTPRYRPRLDIVWLALAPLGIVAFSAYLASATGDAFAWRTSQDVFGRVATDPIQGAWSGIRAGIEALGPDRGSFASLNLYNLAFLVFALVATVGILRRLPIAYGAYVIVALVIPLSAPIPEEPLRSLPRFTLVLFPLWMWLATVVERRGLTKPVTAISAVGLVLLTAAFATWHQVI